MSWTSANHTDADFESNSGWQALRRNGDMQRVAPEGVDALRRRADSLLDEMMLGMVDIAPGDGGHAPSVAAKGTASFGAPYANGGSSVNGSGNGAYQGAQSAQGSHEEPRNGFGATAYSNGAGANGANGAISYGEPRGGEANGSAYTGAAGNGYYPSRPAAASDYGNAPGAANGYANGNGGAASHSQTSEPWSGGGSPHSANGSSRTAAQPYSAYAAGNYQPAAPTPAAAAMTGGFDANGFAESTPQAGHRNPHRGQTSLDPALGYRPEAGFVNGMDGRASSTSTMVTGHPPLAAPMAPAMPKALRRRVSTATGPTAERLRPATMVQATAPLPTTAPPWSTFLGWMSAVHPPVRRGSQLIWATAAGAAGIR
jgi:hypothetical protein